MDGMSFFGFLCVVLMSIAYIGIILYLALSYVYFKLRYKGWKKK